MHVACAAIVRWCDSCAFSYPTCMVNWSSDNWLPTVLCVGRYLYNTLDFNKSVHYTKLVCTNLLCTNCVVHSAELCMHIAHNSVAQTLFWSRTPLYMYVQISYYLYTYTYFTTMPTLNSSTSHWTSSVQLAFHAFVHRPHGNHNGDVALGLLTCSDNWRSDKDKWLPIMLIMTKLSVSHRKTIMLKDLNHFGPEGYGVGCKSTKLGTYDEFTVWKDVLICLINHQLFQLCWRLWRLQVFLISTWKRPCSYSINMFYYKTSIKSLKIKIQKTFSFSTSW